MPKAAASSSFTMEDQERVRFQNDPLQTVVWQLRFPPNWSIDDPSFAARFQAAIGDEYPRAEPRGTQINLPFVEGASIGAPEPAPWQFRDQTGDWVAAVRRDFLSLETTQYTRFEDFGSRLERLLDVMERELPLRFISRVGLRYIDRIRHPELTTAADSTRFLNPALLGLIAGEQIAPYVLDAMQQLRLSIDPGQLQIRHGYLGLELDPEGPSYLIDIDASHAEEIPYDRHACLAMTADFKRHCWNFFRQSLTDRLVTHLDPKPLDD